MSAPTGAPGPSGSPPRRDQGSVAVGVGLAFGVPVSFLVATWLSSLLSIFLLGNFLWFLAPPVAYIVGVHVYAISQDKTRILTGFWITMGVFILIFLVSCFALIQAFSGG